MRSSRCECCHGVLLQAATHTLETMRLIAGQRGWLSVINPGLTLFSIVLSNLMLSLYLTFEGRGKSVSGGLVGGWRSWGRVTAADCGLPPSVGKEAPIGIQATAPRRLFF